MRHVFIINPRAGKRDQTARIYEMANHLRSAHGLDCTCMLTDRPGGATEMARRLAEEGLPLRVYACGGDGTVSEVANGLAGFSNAAMTCIPVGTGNDFLKNFGDKAPLFSDPENLWDGPAFPLDAIDCNGRLALTVACSGFDAQVADDVHTYGKLPLLGGQGSYIVSLGVNFLLRGLRHSWTVILDGKPLPERSFVLAAVCNGRYYGGGFMPVAEAKMDDGVLNTLVVRGVSRATFLRLVGDYSVGRYYKFPEAARCYTAREIVIRSGDGKDIVTCLDGECAYSREVTLRLLEKKVNFFGPAGCSPNATCVPLPT